MNCLQPYRFTPRTGLWPVSLSFAAGLCLTSWLQAQTTPTAAPAPSTGANAAVSTNPEDQGSTASSPVQLSPFEVQEGKDNGYAALNSNSITGFNASLDKLPLSAQVFDQTFMNDVGATSVESMLENYGGAGFGGADPGGTAATQQPGDRNGNSYLMIRGFATPVMVRDSFMTVGSVGNPGSTGVGLTNNFDIDRVEMIEGPQALLYGAGGGAGGVINVVSKQARLGAPTFGSDRFLVDNYGTKYNYFDYGTGTNEWAVRLAFVNGTQDYDRINIGGPLNGYYAQVAFELPFKTTVRVTTEGTTYNRINNASSSVTTPTGTGGDPRNGDSLAFLLATNQAGAINPANGQPYPSGAIDNGLLNWSNVNSYEGWQAAELTTNQFSTIEADSEWTSWLSTQVQAGFDDYRDDRQNASFAFLAPNASGNTLGNVWAADISPEDTTEPVYSKSIRLAALITNDLFGGAVHSQTNLGADETTSISGEFQYTYYEADSNWNLLGGGTAANDGRIPQPKLVWPITNGPVLYALPSPLTKYYTWGGVNYVRELSNPVNPTLIGPNDPLGVNLGGSNYSINESNNRGLFGVNYTQWLDGKLDTLVGLRIGRFYFADQNQGSAPTASSPNSNAYRISGGNTPSYNVGIDYSITSWLHPYIEASDSWDPPISESANPLGVLPLDAHGVGGEAGFKIDTPNQVFSGTLAYFHTDSTNEQLTMSSTIENDVNPAGLNGRWNSPNQWTNIDRDSQGLELTLVGNPTHNWRLMFHALYTSGKIGDTISFNQVYNDQFYENSAGDVTYANGTIVYVNGAATNASTAVEEAPGTAGAVPLTVTAMSTSSSQYYANPSLVNGAISTSSNVAKIILNPKYTSTNGAIATGVSGLPMSYYQLNTALTGIVPAGTIIAAEAGDQSTGYPAYSANLTSIYTFSDGALKGLELGGSVSAEWEYKYYYYFANGVTPTGAGRTLYYLPNDCTVNPIIAYTHKFGRISFTTQLNIYNLFNHYTVLLFPNENSGYAVSSTGASFGRETPRWYQWSNTISF